MNIQLNSIHLSELFLHATSNVIGTLHNHIVKKMQTLSTYIRYNEVTLTTTTLGFNFACIILTEKIRELACYHFKLHSLETTWVYKGIDVFFKTMIVTAGLCALNRMMNLQLTQTYIIISVVSSIATHHICQDIVFPVLRKYCKPSNRLAQRDLEGKESAFEEEDKIKLVDEEIYADAYCTTDQVSRIKRRNDQSRLNVQRNAPKEKVSQQDLSPQDQGSSHESDSGVLNYSGLSDSDNSEGSKLIKSGILDCRLNELENLDS